MSTPKRTIRSTSRDETLAIGRQVGIGVSPRTLVALDGQLGSGKTVFALGVARGLGIQTWRGSPTFNLVHEYSGRLPMFHVDAYRITSGEFFELDPDRMVDANGVVVVEWADRVREALDLVSFTSRLQVRICDTGDDRRQIEIQQ